MRLIKSKSGSGSQRKTTGGNQRETSRDSNNEKVRRNDLKFLAAQK